MANSLAGWSGAWKVGDNGPGMSMAEEVCTWLHDISVQQEACITGRNQTALGDESWSRAGTTSTWTEWLWGVWEMELKGTGSDSLRLTQLQSPRTSSLQQDTNVEPPTWHHSGD